MKGGGSTPVQQISTNTKSATDAPPGSKTVKQPTAEQLRYAQLLSSGDDQCKFQESIKQVGDVTGRAHDIVSVALHDSNFDTEMAILSLLEGKYDDQENEWTTASSRKKKHQGTMQQGLDSITASPIIPTDNNIKTTTSSKPPGRGQGNRNQNKGRQQNDGGFASENHTNTQNGSSTNEPSGKGRGFRNDERWQPRNDRGPGGRGRGRPRRGTSGRGRPERFGGSRNRDNSGSRPGGNFSNKNTDSFNGTAQVNDITGSELWGKAESQQPTTGGWGETLPSSEDWGSEDVEVETSSVPVSGQENPFTENNRVPPTSDSWSDRVDSWEPPITQTSEPVTFPTPEQEHPPYSLESLDKAVIHSKLAKNPYPKPDQPDAVSSQLPSMPHIPMPSGIVEKVNGQHSKLLLSEITAMANNHAQPQAQRQAKGPRSKRPPRSQIPVQAVEMPGQSSSDALDVQFGNLEFGGDPLSSPRFSEESKPTPTASESTPATTQSIKPVEPAAPVSTPISLATTSAVTSLEQQSSLNFQSHPVSRELPQSTKIPNPIPLPSQMDTRDAKPGSITIHKSVDNNKERSAAPVMSMPPSTIPPSMGQSSRTQHSTLPSQLMNKPVSHPSLSTQPTQHSIPQQLKTQTHHTSSLSTHPTAHIGLPSQLTSQGVSLSTQLAQQSSIPPQLQQQSVHMSPMHPQLASQLSSQLSSVTSNSSLDQRVHQPAHGVVQSSLGVTDHSSTQNHTTSSITKPGLPATANMTNIPAPPPGVNISMTSAYNTVNSLQGSVTTSSSARPQLHANKPNFPQGVVPLSMFNMPQPPGMIPYAAALPPYGFDENMQMLQRMPLTQHYYDMPQFQTAGRDGLPTNYAGADAKFGRNDTSSPVPPSTISQGGHQQAFMNTLPQFGYGNLAFYTGGVMPSGFPAYTGPPIYQQMPVTTHGGGSKYQHNYVAQPGSQSYNTSGYDDLGTNQEFSKSPYHSHTSNNQGQSKTNTGSLNSGSTGNTDLTGTNTFKTQYDSKNFLGGTPPPTMNLTNQVGQVGPLNNYHHHGAAMHYMAPQQHPSLYHHPHQPHHMHQHMDSSQGSSVRSQTSGNQKTGLNKPHQNAPAPYQQTAFWSGNH